MEVLAKQNESHYYFLFLLYLDFSIIAMLSSITLVSISSNNNMSTFVITWPSENIQNIANYSVRISSSQYGRTEINTSVSTATINLNYSSSYNISISQSACTVKEYSVFTLGKYMHTYLGGINESYTMLYISYLDCQLLKDYHVILYSVYMNSSMTALINTSNCQIETLKCNESKWDGKNIKKITSYNGKSSWITEAYFH